MKYFEAKGETREAAIENALRELGLSRDDVSVEVLQEAKSGFLGLGKQPAIVRVAYQDEPAPAQRAVEFLEGLLQRFGTPAQLHVTEDPEARTVAIELTGENMNQVIGHHGDTLDAIQYLTNIVTNRQEGDRWRVTVDTEQYRAKREESLIALARKTAQKALKYRKPVALEPMNPLERRTIHAALQETAGVTTYSVGTEPNRKVVVAPEGMEQVKPASGNSGKPRSGNHRRRGPRRPAGNRPAAER
ncbi:MAG: protein jag [Clostridia bacterium]|nr:protein jag [Clostridia bacterium]